MTISLIFSVVIYTINYNEINLRLQSFEESIIEIQPGVYTDAFPSGLKGTRTAEVAVAAHQLVWALIWVNITVLVAGGLTSYFFARRTLAPIEKAHESQSRFTSDASHELRTPLAAMKTELEVAIRDKSPSAAELRETLASSLEEVNKLIQLSETLLTLSRLDHSGLEKNVVDVVALYQDKIADYKHESKRLELTSRKRALIEANPAAIKELIGILIENALKYSPPKSPIKVRIFEKRGFITFSISNEGKRIPAKHLPRLFDRFYRVDTSRSRGHENGYGLGLSIAKKIVDVHGGTIEAKSTDEATTFSWSLSAYKRLSALVTEK
ncbi:GHKL domain-containing protein [Candidatus Saccharibacteria bacterium]|nr:GHKL domain-containing protein [Candidatus Saccharibacteria bacterium]